MMKKRYFLLTILIFIVVFFSGCNSTPEEKSKDDIIQDVSESKYYSESYPEFSINDLTIVKRQTDIENKTDKVYVTLSVMNNDERIQGNIDMEVLYGLYNDGWIFESCEVDLQGENGGCTFIPLKGRDLTSGQIKDDLLILNDNKMEVTINEHEFNAEKGIETYSVTSIANHKYMTSKQKITLTYEFRKDVGTWDVPLINVDSKDENWKIGGKYSYTYGQTGRSYTFKLSPDFFSGNYPDTVEGSTLMSSYDITPDEFFALYVGDQFMRDYLSHGYSVVFDGSLNFYSFDYCLAGLKQEEGAPLAPALFIGKDNIALFLYKDYEKDEYNKKINIILTELHKK